MDFNNGRSDYLKYWRVIRHFYKVKHGLDQCDIDMLLFLYSEIYFSRDKFVEYNQLLSWNKTRFNKLLNEGWIEVFRKRMGKRRAIYQLTYKCKRTINEIYKKLNGDEIPTSTHNPMFLKNVSYSDKVYRNMIIEMNKTIQQQRHQIPEE
jgi:hypothetical protein